MLFLVSEQELWELKGAQLKKREASVTGREQHQKFSHVFSVRLIQEKFTRLYYSVPTVQRVSQTSKHRGMESANCSWCLGLCYKKAISLLYSRTESLV